MSVSIRYEVPKKITYKERFERIRYLALLSGSYRFTDKPYVHMEGARGQCWCCGEFNPEYTSVDMYQVGACCYRQIVGE
jgi:hypothetical protein